MLTADRDETNDPYLLLAGRLSRTYCTEGDLASANVQGLIWEELSHYYNEVRGNTLSLKTLCLYDS